MMLKYFLFLALTAFSSSVAHKLNKRYLLFPRQSPTRHQFIGGIGIPADLEYESLTVGYVLKAEFFLPWNVTTFRKNPFIPEYQRYLHTHKYLQHKISRWGVYATVETIIDKYGYNGRDCMLQAICEASMTKFVGKTSLWSELLHILLTPSSSYDKDEKNKAEYFEAEKYGKMGECGDYDCNFPIMNLISVVQKNKY